MAPKVGGSIPLVHPKRHFKGRRYFLKNHMRVFSWLFIIAGLWLVLSPFILNYGGIPQWNDIILGVLVGILGLVSLSEVDEND